jgi:hypothetical protein
LAAHPQRKRTFGKHRCGCEANIKTHLKELGCESVNLIYLAEDTFQRKGLVNTAMNSFLKLLFAVGILNFIQLKF